MKVRIVLGALLFILFSAGAASAQRGHGGFGGHHGGGWGGHGGDWGHGGGYYHHGGGYYGHRGGIIIAPPVPRVVVSPGYYEDDYYAPGYYRRGYYRRPYYHHRYYRPYRGYSYNYRRHYHGRW